MDDEEFVAILKNDVDHLLTHLEEVASKEQLEELKTYIRLETRDW
ncbi:hypothetical protein ACM16X_02715 [Haloarcula japonica]